GCNPTSSKFIHTWLRFGEIMRGSLSTLYILLNPTSREILGVAIEVIEPVDERPVAITVILHSVFVLFFISSGIYKK
ncbi:hypothetical protein AB7Y64_16960, partial [Providencia rettgeri]